MVKIRAQDQNSIRDNSLISSDELAVFTIWFQDAVEIRFNLYV